MTDEVLRATDLHDGWDETAWKFNSVCEGFYHLAGGLLKLQNANVKVDDGLLRAVYEKVCKDFIGD